MNINNYSKPISSIQKEKSPDKLFVINNTYEEFLQSLGLENFENIWAFKKGELIEKKKDRSIYRIQFSKNDHKNQTLLKEKNVVFYIKKYRQKLSLLHRLFSHFSTKRSFAEGLTEFYHYCIFRKNGLATAIPVAAGMKWSSFFHVDSFLITQDYSPLIDLEHFILNTPLELQGACNQRKRGNILREIALYAKRMHDSNLNQKDFNATHILLADIESEIPKVALFDLQHVSTNRFSKFRWPIKAFAELNFSLQSFLFDDHEKRVLFQHYKNTATLSFLGRLQYGWIQKKTEKIARHTKKRGLAPKARGAG